jgi:hypothetical protein
VTDRVDAAVEGVEAAEPGAPADLIVGESERPQLVAADDPVLTCSESGETCVNW